MRTPRLLMGAALVFWGWQTGMLLWAAAMAAALEASHFIRARWELSDTDLNRICDLCLVLFLGAAMVLYSAEDRLLFIFKVTQWLPVCSFPIALAQAYGNRSQMPLRAFSWLLRRASQSALARKSLNISYLYFGLCLLAASASTQPKGYFYLGVSLLILLGLTGVRPRRVSWPVWVVLMAVVIVCGQASHQGLRRLQNDLESVLGGWIADLFRSPPDSRECRTLIGRPGSIRLSGKILLRVRVPPGELPPSLLRECAYDSYRNETWSAGSNAYDSVRIDNSGTAQFLPAKKTFSTVEIAEYLPDGDGLLALPHGTFEIDDFAGPLLGTNCLGVAAVQAAPGLLDFRARYWTGASIDSPPGRLDRIVPENEKRALSAVAADLGLNEITDERQKIRAVSRFFQERFRYSLHVPRRSGRNPLDQFLTETRAGHCQYFATATVLLLRQVGVSARYVTGYAVPEVARRGDTYYVRERHAHAWALVFHSDTQTWEQVDNTPSRWKEGAEAPPPWWEPASDFVSNLYFQFSKWRWSKTSYARYAQRALAPLILYLVWRILSTRRRKHSAPAAPAQAPEPPWPGLDSELYMIDRRLAGAGLARQPNEPLDLWQRRLEEALPPSPALGRVFLMHRRLRFDPRGLQSAEREVLRRHAAEWLEEFSRAKQPAAGFSDNQPLHSEAR